jgi:hypothetical protein
MMDKFDKEEMRQTMTDVLAIHAADVHGQFALVNLKLEEIGKLSIRVTDLETKPHPIEVCSQAATVKELRDNMVTVRAERKFIGKVGAIGAAAITIILTIIKFFIV